MSQFGKEESRRNRGQVTTDYMGRFSNEPTDALLNLLADQDAQVRTAAATLLGERKAALAVQSLCRALANETALYARLAICEALGRIGDPAIDPLIALLGKIGSNQHRELPQKGFYKQSYPLPRDIAARTLIRMGLPVLEKIKPVLQTMQRIQLLEAVDVIGHLSNQYTDEACLPNLLAIYDASKNDELMQWKILRSYQAFPHQQVTEILLRVIQHAKIAPLRWEAVRSLGLQQRGFDRQLLQILKNDGDREVSNLVNYYF